MSEGAPSNQRPPPSSSSSSSPMMTHRDGPRMGSPVTPLAPLEFLQNQRRGSITDPSLHAAGSPNASKHGLVGRGPSYLLAAEREGDTERIKIEGPATPYVFGDATIGAKAVKESPAQLRKILRSPMEDERSPGAGPSASAGADRDDEPGERAVRPLGN
jgi:hypothetical protein